MHAGKHGSIIEGQMRIQNETYAFDEPQTKLFMLDGNGDTVDHHKKYNSVK